MPIHLQIRDVPDELHEVLRRRAEARGMSLRQYALEVLAEHCRKPTINEWLDSLSRLPRSRSSTMSGAEAVRLAREEEDDHLFDVLSRRR